MSLEFGNAVALALTGLLRALQESVHPRQHASHATQTLSGKAKSKLTKLSGCRIDSARLMSRQKVQSNEFPIAMVYRDVQ